MQILSLLYRNISLSLSLSVFLSATTNDTEFHRGRLKYYSSVLEAYLK